ncbi:hypothetical protein MNBD_GAMMA10-2447 [hydrothermal vent metagenome]|uniref:Uncharacterized protein n=1 Tax=hydrothermal vent metagenome TaxID=652676 RepID=A0A3B0Y6R8_9ZZZZ
MNAVLRIFSILLLSFFASFQSFAKPMPSAFSELIAKSDLIAIVDVFEISARGKSMPASASARVIERISGAAEKDTITLHWEGIAIYELGQWVVFLKKEDEAYRATYGARSFWKIEQAIIDNAECCSAFVVLRPPIDSLRIDPSLVSSYPVYMNDVPEKSRPLMTKGVSISNLKNYIKNTIKKDK